MIITKLEKRQAEIPLEGTVDEPDPNWSHTLSDGKVVKWQQDGEDWHIPGLLKQIRLGEPLHDPQGRYIGTGLDQEYYTDPTNDDEIEPGYIIRLKTRYIAGKTEIECEVLLTGDEVAWLQPRLDVLENPNEYKRKIAVDWMGVRLLLTGVWLQSHGGSEDGLFECTLSVDRAEAMDPNLRLTEIGNVKP